MKRTTVAITLAMAIGVATSHAQVRTDNPQDKRTGGVPAARPAAGTGETDSRVFVNELGVAGMTEIRLGEIAAERASHADVKAFGKMMVNDHTEAAMKLAQIASQLNLQMPSAPDAKHQQLIDRLSTLKGKAFDREYVAAMVKGHEEVTARLRSRSEALITATATDNVTRAETGDGASPVGSSGSDARDKRVATGGEAGEEALTQWASKTLPTVQQHLEKAKSLQTSVK